MEELNKECCQQPKDFRHVCFKDLENYRRKDDLFDDITDYERTVILNNLHINAIEGNVTAKLMQSFIELFE